MNLLMMMMLNVLIASCLVLCAATADTDTSDAAEQLQQKEIRFGKTTNKVKKLLDEIRALVSLNNRMKTKPYELDVQLTGMADFRSEAREAGTFSDIKDDLKQLNGDARRAKAITSKWAQKLQRLVGDGTELNADVTEFTELVKPYRTCEVMMASSSNYKLHENKCYYMARSIQSATLAEGACEKLGGSLISPVTNDTINYLNENFHYSNGKFLVGATSEPNDPNFYWHSNNQRVTNEVVSWAHTQPDDTRVQACLTINKQNGGDWEFKDYGCAAAHWYICVVDPTQAE